jgi:hypothetical protein
MRGITGGVKVEHSAPSRAAEAANKWIVQRIVEAGILQGSSPAILVSKVMLQIMNVVKSNGRRSSQNHKYPVSRSSSFQNGSYLR